MIYKKYKDLMLKNIDVISHFVMIENQNQLEKWGVQEHYGSEWLMFLTEEVGELAEAIANVQYRNGNPVEVINEAIQVATLAFKIIEMYRDSIPEE